MFSALYLKVSPELLLLPFADSFNLYRFEFHLSRLDQSAEIVERTRLGIDLNEKERVKELEKST